MKDRKYADCNQSIKELTHGKGIIHCAEGKK